MQSTKKFITKCMQVNTSLEWCESLLSEFNDLETLQLIKSIKKTYKDKAIERMRKEKISEIKVSLTKTKSAELKITM
jgi:hypothetical protein